MEILEFPNGVVLKMRSQLKKAAAITLMAASLSSFVGCTNANDVSDSSLKQTEPVKQTGEAATSQVRLPAAFADWDKVDNYYFVPAGDGYVFKSD